MSERIGALLGIPAGSPYLAEALIHPSYANENRAPRNNQRLELLGDAVLGLCASELLWTRFPDADEGALTRMRAQLVNAQSLARWARRHRIADDLKLGRGAEANGLGDSTNVLADTVEALIAAAYLAGGLDTARRACALVIEPELAAMENAAARDPKSELQERVQAEGGEPPVYEVIDAVGPAHDLCFTVRVRVGEQPVGEGRGRSKRAAERAAALAALGAWGGVGASPDER